MRFLKFKTVPTLVTNYSVQVFLTMPNMLFSLTLIPFLSVKKTYRVEFLGRQNDSDPKLGVVSQSHWRTQSSTYTPLRQSWPSGRVFQTKLTNGKGLLGNLCAE